MKRLAILACILVFAPIAWAANHGPVFGYATPVNSQGEFSFDTGLFGRNGSFWNAVLDRQSDRLWPDTPPHLECIRSGYLRQRVSTRVADFSHGRVTQGRPGASSTLLHRWANDSRRPAPWLYWCRDHKPTRAFSGIGTGLLASPVRSRLVTPLAANTSGSEAAIQGSSKTREAGAPTQSRGARYTASGRHGCGEAMTNGTTADLPSSPGSIRAAFACEMRLCRTAARPRSGSDPRFSRSSRMLRSKAGSKDRSNRDVSTSVYGRETVRFALNFSYLKFSSQTGTH